MSFIRKDLLEILGTPYLFLDSVFLNLKSDKIDVKDYFLDHICYNLQSIEKYEYLKKIISDHGKMLSEKNISGRPISIFKLDTPIVYENRVINVLELSSPKDGSIAKEGREHVEFVIDIELEEFIGKYENIIFETKRLYKELNPDIAIKYLDCRVKFHKQSLQYVIEFLE